MKKKVIKADEEIRLDAPVVRIHDANYYPTPPGDYGKYGHQRSNSGTTMLRRLWNVVTCPVRYVLFGVWRI